MEEQGRTQVLSPFNLHPKGR